MAQLYTKGGSTPVTLPFRIKLSDGRSRTDPASFTAEEIADAGYVAVSPRPAPGPDQFVSWGGSDWVVRAKTAAELAAEAAAARSALHTQLAGYRWGVETGGITLPTGIEVATDDRSKALINGALESLERGYYTSTKFKAVNGTFTLTLAEMAPLAEAVSLHVRDCFSAESTVAAQIDTLTDAELSGFDVVAAFDAAMAAQAGQGGGV
ncbi:DUF4376 domain-containing protein [Phaeobacter gallaeciensis]|uniref:DUF4376 domain-containing protein n=1 Tax=Phaeobacter gallaeciensis TaxID=60890 RepID=UPI00237F7C9E|nr:DUF4376 domain-containing protein [Phaeobacter gallaeciensis]MDE4302843.1 DUF4376 domain-containing protein [Phaeobacter gallaeciensis]MDE4307064.1 DUF4376 domain-containing protein [Phaeobacter gallaeciensis]MDE4311529.1 DUF4376 domain-containing protein [Phaeobacter gallaeciensis]MDE4316164.1 DUF4376 domain-containing protein [Phaeobacter gallaeciensis]MDE4320456.1 DUF4376 domain-containing protein [Phaeobacter gallaeciensis]